MAARNGPNSFGWVSRLLHWLMAIGLLGNLGFGAYLARTEPTFSTLWMYGAHKSAGMTLLILVLLRIVWHRISPVPEPVSQNVPKWQHAAARAGHLALYLLMLAVPLSGWIASSATGIPTIVFNQWTLPGIAPVSETWDTLGFAAHGILTKLLIAVVIIHVAAALQHAVIYQNATLRRMVSGR